MSRISGRPLPVLFVGCVAATILWAPLAYAAPITFRTQIQGTERVATVELVSQQGMDYVSLAALTEQFGGGHEILPTRMKVDLVGSSVWVQINDRRVRSLTIFSLRHPVLRSGQDILIAREDVFTFFSNGFRLSVTADTPRLGGARPPDFSVRRPPQGDGQAVRGEPSAVATGAAGAAKNGARAIGVIVIDPGHGSYDEGIQGRGGFQEKDLVLKVSLKLQEILMESLPQRIVLTRTEDIELSAKQRALFANNSQGDLLVSIHAGGAFSSAANGAALFYPSPALETAGTRAASALGAPLASRRDFSRQSGELARAIAESFSNETSAAIRGVREAPSRLLKQAAMPGVLIEVGCLTNPSEEALLEMDSYQNKIARGIAQGIVEYLEAHQATTLQFPSRIVIP